MKKLFTKLKSIFVIGIGVLLPVAFLTFLFAWVISGFTGLIQPATAKIVTWLGINFSIANIISFVAIIILCFIVGWFVKTRVGNFIHNKLEDSILKRIPGYKILREAIVQFTNKEKSPFNKPVFAYPFSNKTKLLGFASDLPDDPSIEVTVFVPTSPNPTSGMIYIVPRKNIRFIEAEFEDVMKIIVSGGMGASSLKVVS